MRPSCQACLSRRKECAYEFEEGRPSVATLRSEIRVLKEQNSKYHSINQTPAAEVNAQAQALSVASSAHKSLSQLPTSIEESLPSNSATQEAVDRYFSSSGELFHPFNRSQVSLLTDAVWINANSDTHSRKADICCLMAVAAAGAQYDVSGDAGTSSVFYRTAKMYLDNVLEERPLDAIKVCTLLCHYNIMDKPITSLAYAGKDTYP